MIKRVLICALGLTPTLVCAANNSIYEKRFVIVGYLLRSSGACNPNEAIKTADVAMRLESSPELRAVASAFPNTIETWQMKGAAIFNDSAMMKGISSTCANAIRIRDQESFKLPQ